jgi:YVTN family beta-propeller protein
MGTMAGKSGFIRALPALFVALLVLTPPALAQARAYLPLIDIDEVEVVELDTHTSLGTILVGAFPSGVATSPNGLRVYVTNGQDGTVSVIDTTIGGFGAVIATVPVGTCCTAPLGVAASPDNTLAFVANFGEDEVNVIDVSTNQVITNIPVGILPGGIAFSPDGAFAYVANWFDSTVSVIDAGSLTVVDTISVGGFGPMGLAVSPDGSRVYTANEGDSTVSVIDTSSNTVLADIPTQGFGIQGLAVSADGDFVYVADQGGDQVIVIDAVGLVEDDIIPVGIAPTGVSVDPVTGLVYVAVTGGQEMARIDPATNTVLGVTFLAGEPFSFGVFIAPAGPAIVPTLSEWAMIALGLMLAAGGFLYLRRRPTSAT